MKGAFLTENQRKYLEVLVDEGDPSDEEHRSELIRRGVDQSYLGRPDMLEKEIDERVDELPAWMATLFHELHRELELLTKAGYLTPEINQELWGELGERSARGDNHDRSEQFQHPADPGAADFAKEFGTLCRCLSFVPYVMETDDVLTELVWGFMRGVSNDSLRFEVDCTEQLAERAQLRRKEAREGIDALQEWSERLGERIGKEYDRIEELLEEQGIAFDECLPGQNIDRN